MEYQVSEKPTFNIIDNSAVYEFTKSFVKSALSQFGKLDGVSERRKYYEIGGTAVGSAAALGSTAAGGSLIRHLIGSSIKSGAEYYDKIQQEKRKISVISIIDAKSSQTFHADFLLLFIRLGLRLYHLHRDYFEYINLKTGHESTIANANNENKLLAIQKLGEYGGTTCFSLMLKDGSKNEDELLDGLSKESMKRDLASKWDSKILVELYFWVQKESGEIKQKLITPYDFFADQVFSSPAYTGNFKSDDEELENQNQNPLNSESEGRQKKYKLLKTNKDKGSTVFLDYSYDCQEVDLNCLANLIYGKIIHDKSFCWSVAVLETIEDIYRLLQAVNTNFSVLNDKLMENIDTCKEIKVIAEKIPEQFAQLLLLEKKEAVPPTTTSKCELKSGNIEQEPGMTRIVHNHVNSGIVVSGNMQTRDVSVTQVIHTPETLPPKNIRFKVQKPIQTFTGRVDFLNDLHNQVRNSRGQGSRNLIILTQSPLSVIAATGGIGKTETLRMYIQLHGSEYDHILWIDSDNQSFARSQFFKLATELEIQTEFENKPKDFDVVLKQVYDKLCQHAHLVLLVFDNAEALDDEPENHLSGIRSFLPDSLSPFFIEPTVLVTSRNQNWRLQNIIELDLWTMGEVVTFVLTQLQLENSPANQSKAVELGTLFGRLPIALQSAVAVIKQQSKRRTRKQQYQIQDLISDYENGNRRVLKEKPWDSNMRPTKSNIIILILWNVSLEKIIKTQNGLAAIRILCLMAYLLPTTIPTQFLTSLLERDYNEDTLEDALELLEDYSLITRYESHYTIHRMIQDATIENLRIKPKTNPENAAAKILFNENTFPDENAVLTKLAQYLKQYIAERSPKTERDGGILANYDHVVSNHMSNKLVGNQQFKELTAQIGQVFHQANEFKKAKELYARVIEATEKEGNNSAKSEEYHLVTKGKMAGVLFDLGEFQQSKEMYLEVLQLQLKSLGPHHSETLNTKTCVAFMLKHEGHTAKAMEMYEDVLNGREENQELQSSPDTLITKNNLATCYMALGKSSDALKMLSEILEAQEGNPDCDSKDKIRTLNNIATALLSQGPGQRRKASEILAELQERAERELGPTHVYTFQIKTSYGNVLHSQGQYKSAMEIITQVLIAQEEQLGPLHLDTLSTQNSLGVILNENGQEGKSITMLLEVAKARHSVLGPGHPQTISTKTNLISICNQHRQYDVALEISKQLLLVHSESLGQCHSSTLEIKFNIGHFYYFKEDFEKAARVARDVMDARKKEIRILGIQLQPKYPDYVDALRLLVNSKQKYLINLQRNVAQKMDVVEASNRVTNGGSANVEPAAQLRFRQFLDRKIEIEMEQFFDTEISPSALSLLYEPKIEP